jgi:phosphatidylserine/phosphatidylglycerophosphate/cardiolipin synthase-like enzyme
VPDLQVTLGAAARPVLCDAFAAAHHTIEAQLYNVNDPAVVDALNAAAQRGVSVTLYVEGDRGRFRHTGSHVPAPSHVRKTAAAYLKLFDRRVHVVVEGDILSLEHAKAAVIDGKRAFIATANANATGFGDPGEALVADAAPPDVSAIRDTIAGRTAFSERVVSGPSTELRSRIAALLEAPHDERIAAEGLSDPAIVVALLQRHAKGLRDEVLVDHKKKATRVMRYLAAAGVDIRTLPNAHLHEKYVDTGDRIYLGSANLTYDGLNKSREIGIVAPAADFGAGADALRADFAAMWARASPIGA